MNIGDCSAKTAFRTASHTSREVCRATTWHTQPNESDSAGCAALHPRLFTGDRYAVASLALPPVLELPRCASTVGEILASSCTATRTPRMCPLRSIRLVYLGHLSPFRQKGPTCRLADQPYFSSDDTANEDPLEKQKVLPSSSSRSTEPLASSFMLRTAAGGFPSPTSSKWTSVRSGFPS